MEFLPSYSKNSADRLDQLLEKNRAMLSEELKEVNLYRSLFSILQAPLSDSKTFFQGLVAKIRELSECDACSLWYVNTPDDAEDNDQQNNHRTRFVSLVARELKKGLTAQNGESATTFLKKEVNFVHQYEGSFTEMAITKCEETNLPHCLCSDQNLLKTYSYFGIFVESCGIQHVIGIPIKNFEKGQEFISILLLSFKEKPGNGLLNNKEFLESFSKTVSSCITRCYDLVLSQKKQELLGKFRV